MARVKTKMARGDLATLLVMGEGPPKPTPARLAIAENLKKLMGEYVTETGKEGLSSRDLASRASGVSYKTIQRLLNPNFPASPTLDSLDAVADFFRIETFKLLVLRRNILLAGREFRPQETQAIQGVIPSKVKKSQIKKA